MLVTQNGTYVAYISTLTRISLICTLLLCLEGRTLIVFNSTIIAKFKMSFNSGTSKLNPIIIMAKRDSLAPDITSKEWSIQAMDDTHECTIQPLCSTLGQISLRYFVCGTHIHIGPKDHCVSSYTISITTQCSNSSSEHTKQAIIASIESESSPLLAFFLLT